MLFFISFITILGLLIGSFLAAFSYRLPRKISIAKGRSFCPNCKKMIGWYDNIPLFSFLLLGGKCRHCKKPISFRYPLIEFFTAFGFFLISYHFYPDILPLIFSLLVYSLMVLIFVIDLEHQIIPDVLIFAGIAFVFLYFLITNTYMFPNIFAGFLASVFLVLIHLATKGRGMGLGDVKFAVLGGLITGLNLFLVWLFASFLTGGIVGIILILGRRAGLKDKIAFGPFLVIGLVLTILYGNVFLKFLGF